MQIIHIYINPFIKMSNLNLMKTNSPFYSNKFFHFYRFSWLSQYLRSVVFNSNIIIATLEPSLDDDSFRLCFCQGTFVSAFFNLNSISVTLKQTFGSVFVNRTFFLNSNNFIYFKNLK